MKGWAQRMLRSLFPDDPERGRLEGAIQETVVALAQAKAEKLENEWWYRCADQQLERARYFLAEGNPHRGWVSVHSAKALLLLNPHRELDTPPGGDRTAIRHGEAVRSTREGDCGLDL
jgi:hypothetical protein